MVKNFGKSQTPYFYKLEDRIWRVGLLIDPGLGVNLKDFQHLIDPFRQHQGDPLGPAFDCARLCFNNPECTHWGVNEKEINEDGLPGLVFCQLRKNVTGRKYNQHFRYSGNRACAQGTLGVGKVH